MTRRVAALAAAAWLVFGCAAAAPTPSTAPTSSRSVQPSPAPASASASAPASAPAPAAPSPAPSVALDRVAGWTSDLQALLPALDRLHPDPYHSTSKAELEAAVGALIDQVPELDDDQVLVGLMRIVAMVSATGKDGHTGAFIWGTGTHQISSLPLRVWLFPDGLYVVDALDPYRELVGQRIEAIGGHATDDVLAALDPLVPRDNATTVQLVTPRFLLIPEVLHGLGLIDDTARVSLGLGAESGGAGHKVEVTPISRADYNAWAGSYGLFLPSDPDVPYLSRTEELLWWTMLEDSGTLFVQYNRVEAIDQSVFDDLAAAAAKPGVKRVVVDLRFNYGGQVGDYDPLLKVLADPSVDRPGRLFVILGRNTFSAASMFASLVEQQTSARFVGEPMGGSPNLYGNSEDVPLRWSGVVVSVSTTEEVTTSMDDPRLTIEPDLPAPLSSMDYFAGRDPSLEAILASSTP